MQKHGYGVAVASRLALALAIALGGLGVNAATAAGDSPDNFGHAIYMCAHAMLPYEIDSHGGLTMLMPDGSMMHWRNFGAMVIYMRSNDMCS